MSFTAYSKFYFGHTVTDLNGSIDFSEGGPELQATLNVGSYTLTEYLVEIKRAMEAAGALTYTVSVNRATRVITISSTSNFELLTTSGTRVGSHAFPMMGFSGADKTGATTYAGGSGSGSEYKPQFYLQDHTDSEDYQEAVDASINESASGEIEVVNFGLRKFVELNIQYITDDDPTPHPWIRSQSNALSNTRMFLRYLTTKAPVEFIPDEDVPSAFQKVFLESSPASGSGTGYKLIERVSDRLERMYDTGVLKFRVVET